MLKTSNIANDNFPPEMSSVADLAYNVRKQYLKNVRRGSQYPARANQMTRAYNVSPTSARIATMNSVNYSSKLDETASARAPERNSLVLSIAAWVWLAALAANIWAFMSAPVNSIHLAIVLCGLWASLALSFIAHRHDRAMLSEIAALATVFAFTLSIYITSLRFGLFIGTGLSAGLTTLAALALSVTLRSTLCLRVSAVIAIAWTALSISTSDMQTLLWVMPVLLPALIYAASLLRDKPSVYLSALAGYGWLIGIIGTAMLSGAISPVMAALGLFTAGALHNRLGKLAQDQSGFAGLTHTNIGWAVFMASLLVLEWVWLSGSVSIAGLTLSPKAPISSLWSLPITLSLLGVLMVELRRAYICPQSVFKAIMVTLISAGFVYMSLHADAFNAAFTAYNFKSLPISGLMLGAAITALALAMTANGFRRHARPMVILGLFMISAQLIISMETIRYSLESILIFGISAFVMSLLATMFVNDREIDSHA